MANEKTKKSPSDGEEVCLDIQVKFYPGPNINDKDARCKCGSQSFSFGPDDGSDDEATEFDHTMICGSCNLVHNVRVRLVKMSPKSECHLPKLDVQ